MKATDKISLLVSGKATMKQIAELEAQEQAEAEAEKKAPAPDPETPEPDYKKMYEELLASKESEASKDKEPEKEPEPDYKAMYEAEAAKVTKLQQANVNKNLKSDEKPEESIENIMIKAYSHP